MKESKLIEMHNKVETLANAMNRVVHELTNLKDLSVGTMELVKCLPDYEKALQTLKDDVLAKKQETDYPPDATKEEKKVIDDIRKTIK
jgi:hypothetical protein